MASRINTDLTGKTALITGGGTGVGRACSLALAEMGAAVFVNFSRSSEEAEKTVSEIRAAGGTAEAIRADVSSDQAVCAMFDRVREVSGRLDILVNSAGITEFVPQEDLDGLTEAMWDRILAVNVKGAFFATRAASKLMREKDGGSVVNVASVAGITGGGSSMAYAASKAALITMTKSMARVLAPNVRVNCISPGIILTRWVDGKKEFVDKQVEVTPLKRGATADDVADGIVYLTTGARHVTGHNLIMDGGMTM